MSAENTLHDLVMKDHTESVLSANRRHLDRYRRKGPAGYLTDSDDHGDDDPMKIISAGNVTVNHPAPSPPPPVKSGMGTLAKLGVGAALLASGVGAGVAIPLIVDALRRPVPVETIKTETVTTENDYSIGEISVERR